MARPIAMVASLALILAACAAPAASQPASTSPSASAPPPTPTPEPTPVPASPSAAASATAAAPLALTWTETTIDADIGAVAADGDRLIGLAEDENSAPTSWVSTDGLTWESVAMPPPTDVIEEGSGVPQEYAAQGSSVEKLVRLDETLYAFGIFNINDFLRPVGWRWTDGQSWQYITSSNAFYESGAVMDAVGGNGTLVASKRGLGISWAGADSTVWAWTAATSWVQGDLAASDGSPVLARNLAWSNGRYLATGFVTTLDDAAPVGRPIAWTSTDGLSWTEIDAPDTDGQVCGLEAGPSGGFVALAISPDAAELFTWADGAGWSGMTLPGGGGGASVMGMPFFGECELATVAGHRLAVLNLEAGIGAWTSSDGIGWETVEGWPVGASPMWEGAGSLAALDDRVVFLSHAGTEEVTTTIHVGTVGP